MQSLMGRCGSECDISETLLAGPEQTQEEIQDHGEKGEKQETQERTGGMLPLL